MNQDTNRYMLAWFFGAGYFAAIVLLVFFEVKEGSAQIVNIMLGSFGTAFGLAISYFFGSSEGSKEKTKLMDKLK